MRQVAAASALPRSGLGIAANWLNAAGPARWRGARMAISVASRSMRPCGAEPATSPARTVLLLA
jgi:hypothetical protein